MKRKIATFLILTGLLGTVLCWPNNNQPAPLNANNPTAGGASNERASRVSAYEISKLLNIAAPTAEAQITYDCDAARQVCFDIYNGVRMLCRQSCAENPGPFGYEWCISACNSSFASNYERCVYTSTNDQCYPFKHMGTRPGDN